MAIGRYAPSPTGELHLGNLRTAVVAWLLAREAGSDFLMRIEDLDPASRSGRFIDGQLADLRALGLDWDGELVFQSQRMDLYHQALDRLVDNGLTFECFCTRSEIREATRAAHDAGRTPGYPGTCKNLTRHQRSAKLASGRPAALRFNSSGETRSFVDRIAGPFEGVVDDLVLRRNDGTPAYNIAVVVDDAQQGVEEVTRGDDLLAATPAQLALCDSLGLPEPTHAHVPLVLGPSGDRLAKRDGAVTLGDLAALGRDPSTVLAWIGHSLGLCERNEPVSISDLLDRFDSDEIEWTPWTLEQDDIS
ncbi:MAG: tRNA glutamyl-Q(34) synthetase GluQRS [Acidimicrobiales bacterium]